MCKTKVVNVNENYWIMSFGENMQVNDLFVGVCLFIRNSLKSINTPSLLHNLHLESSRRADRMRRAKTLKSLLFGGAGQIKNLAGCKTLNPTHLLVDAGIGGPAHLYILKLKNKI